MDPTDAPAQSVPVTRAARRSPEPGVELFVEGRASLELHRAGPGSVRLTREQELGMAQLREEGEARIHTAEALGPERAADRALPAHLRAAIEACAGLAVLEPGAQAALAEVTGRFGEAVTAAGGRSGASAREVIQQMRLQRGEAHSADARRCCLLELKVTVEGQGRSASIQRERAYRDHGGALADDSLARLAEEMVALARARLEAQPVEEGPTTVILPPGADAGVFFHEVCGHPLEGDVVRRGASYLARAPGQQVAAEFVTVADDPTAGGGGLAYAIDDEGSRASAVPLIDAGRVGEPLLDRCAARDLGRAPNGHGRRVSYRTPPIPRMAHTELRPHRGTLEEIVAETPRGLLVRYLTPRHVHLLSGAFSFYVVEAQQIRDGRIGQFVGPCILEGDGLTALRGIDRVGGDLQAFFGLKGCGKLDHGPLPVSFGNPTVRIQGLRVRQWS